MHQRHHIFSRWVGINAKTWRPHLLMQCMKKQGFNPPDFFLIMIKNIMQKEGADNYYWYSSSLKKIQHLKYNHVWINVVQPTLCGIKQNFRLTVKWLSFNFTLKIAFVSFTFSKRFSSLDPFSYPKQNLSCGMCGLINSSRYAVAQKQDLCSDLISLYNKKDGKNKCSTQKSFSLVVSFGTFFFGENHMMII